MQKSSSRLCKIAALKMRDLSFTTGRKKGIGFAGVDNWIDGDRCAFLTSGNSKRDQFSNQLFVPLCGLQCTTLSCSLGSLRATIARAGFVGSRLMG